MAEIVLFHSVLGIRQGVLDAAARLESMGHAVHVPDLYGNRLVFDEYEPAMKHVEEVIGYAGLMERTRAAVASLPAKLVYAGFSNGGVSAEYLAATRPGAVATVLFSAADPLEIFAPFVGGSAPVWPTGVPIEVHYAAGDPFREQAAIDGLRANVEAAGAPFTFHDYPGTGHLFTDRSLPAEYDEASSELVWQRVEAFLRDRR